MAKYRKKPVVIEAVQWDHAESQDEETRPFPQWLLNAISDGTVDRHPIDSKALTIKTLEGNHKCDDGDWIIRGVKGELYPCKPDIFEATYDLVTE